MARKEGHLSSPVAPLSIQNVYVSKPCIARLARLNRAEVLDHPTHPGQNLEGLTNALPSHGLCLERFSRTQNDEVHPPPQPVVFSEKLPEGAKAPTATIISATAEELDADDAHPEKVRIENTGRWARFVEEYRKNYCPRSPPALVLPTPPADKEKLSFVQMHRLFLLVCEVFGMLVLAYGSWKFATGSAIYCWFAIIVTVIELFLLTVVFITIMGKELDLDAHKTTLDSHPLNGEEIPTLDIYLPICKEPLEIIENTWRCISALEYPKEKMSVFVLDDGADEAVKALAKRFDFKYICRPNRPDLKKSGNLRYAFSRTSGDFFTVFDADFCPRPDFFTETMPYLLADDKRAILQTPQFFRSQGSQTWIEQGAGAFQEYTYRLMQPCRDRWGAAICVGSNAIFRRSAFEPIGGMVAVDCSEDIYTSFYAVTHGWSVKYLPLPLACGICPDTPGAFFSQQMRWCHGSVSLVCRRDFWKADTRAMVKLCYLCGASYYIMSAIEPFVFPPVAPLVLIFRPSLFEYYNLFFGFPIIVIGFLGRKIWSRGRYTFSVQYTDRVLQFASAQALWDMIAGNRLSWKPSGGTAGAQKNRRYRNMRILAWAWTIAHTSVFVAVAVWRVVEGLAWYNLVPILVVNSINILWLHRFLLYRHPREVA